MPKLIIDNQEIDVPEGTKVIEAAEQLGIMIPRFCFHPALGSVGACRVCAVKFLQGPIKGIQMSCMVDAADGMVVSTTDQEAVDFRQYVIEWLMLNHPHDCPVCDEGGHCLLQDTTVAGGHGLRRYQGRKRTHHDQNLGPLIQHEMNRCIQCYRCSRFYQEYCGYRDLGVMQIGSRVYFGRYKAGTLESPFSGNLVDICPTGVYTDKPSRFIGRRWDFERSPSVCINCSLGCHTVVSTRYREVVRQEARFSQTVNGHFICDRGRYGHFYASQDQRPRQATIDGRESSWQKAIQTARDRLDRICRESSPAAVACVGSVRSSLEAQAAGERLCQAKGWQAPVYWIDQDVKTNVNTAVSKLAANPAVSLQDLKQADHILAVGVDPLNEAPMLALAMRQAQRCGAKIAVIDPRPIDLPFDFDHLAAAPQAISLVLAHVMKETIDPDTLENTATPLQQFLDKLPNESNDLALDLNLIHTVARDMRPSRRPVIVCNTQWVSKQVPEQAAYFMQLLTKMKKQAGLFYLLPGANAFGAALLSEAAQTFEDILAAIETGSIKALVLVENDPFSYFPDRPRLKRALEQLDLLVVMDYLDDDTRAAADVFLPTMTLYESSGFFVNQEGRVQQACTAFKGGQPISQTSGQKHPPRSFRSDIPGGDARPAWLAITELALETAPAAQQESHADLMTWLTATYPLFADFPTAGTFPDSGFKINPKKDAGANDDQNPPAVTTEEANLADRLELITVDWTFGTEELSSCSPYLQQLEKPPCVLMHRRDADRLGITAGDKVAIRSDAGVVCAPLSIADNMAVGVLVIPRHRRLDWQHLEALKIIVGQDRINKLKEDESC